MLESFLPSRDGFAFVNAWPTQPAVVLPTPLGPIRLGDASAGLCGGMVFSALDYWHAGLATPPERPAPDDPLYGFLVRRLVDSWHVPAGIVQYYQWMSLPDGDRSFTMFGRRVLIERGVCWRTIKVQWPQISTDLDRGVPVPLGVVTVASTDPRDLALNHQVLAFGYSVTGTRIKVQVYDPNRGRRDDTFISFDTGAPTKPTTFEHNLGIGETLVRGFFRAAYTPDHVPGR
ncbi:hypothetical protein Q2K19_22550 [Micromonospora soli]|uniref:hypothetical protein n=1 Tax=Micromonospora sp. NBRC 110009 TaxID=3061627 RepID=UPI0026710DEF|nr:hypothetical protein [Micromonospora sp. NBRC 110009]WKT96950.1 hypothetical protein Q2K19_22550 [Micromonospora sp. NBRC 110009]